MPSIYCKTHYQVPARWNCPQCKIDLCTACVNVGTSITPCPVCDSPMQPLGMGNAITPFWQRLPKFFLYPARRGTLIYLLVLAALSAMVGMDSLLSIPLQAIILFMFVRYGYAALESTAQGYLTTPRLDSDILSENKLLPLKQTGIFIIVATVARFLELPLGVLGDALVALAVCFFLPASIMVLATRHSMMAAINPIGLLEVVRTIGSRYLILWALLWMLLEGSGALQSMLPHSSAFLAQTMLCFLDMYFFLIMFNLMGYVIYQYHQELAYPVSVDFDHTDESVAAQVVMEPDPLLNKAMLLIQQGHVADAKNFLKERIARDPSNLTLRSRYHTLLLQTGEAGELVNHGRTYIPLLVADRKIRQAAEIMRDCMRCDATFHGEDSKQVLPLAQQLRMIREPRLALRIMRNARRRFNKNQNTTSIYLLAAQILCEDLKQDRRAERILRYLLNNYPDSGINDQVHEYLILLGRLKTA